MRKRSKILVGIGLAFGTAAVAGVLVLAPVGAIAGTESGRSYYFSRTAQPYDSYESWLKANPRYMHPYHDTVHGPLFSGATNPQIEEMKTKPDYNQPIFRNPPRGGPWGYARILWVNDRYYSGKYYPTAEQKE